MKRILILGASQFQIPIVKQAKKMGLYVGIADISNSSPAIEYADEYFQCSIKDQERVLDIALKFKPDAVTVGICDSAVNTAAFVCNEMGLPGLSIDVAKKATDKYEMIKAFKDNNVPHPAFEVIHSIPDNDYSPNLVFPIICKPVDCAGSKGINIVYNNDELISAIKNSMFFSQSNTVLLEEYMKGPEVSVELIIIDGVPYVAQITDKITTGPPHFIEIGHTQPSSLSPEVIADIKKTACSAANAIGLNNCIGHAEIIITNRGAKMVEIAGRLGGDSIAEQLIYLSTGYNFPEIDICFSLGLKPEIISHREDRYSAIRFIENERNGVIKDILGVAEAERITDIYEIGFMKKIGDKSENVTENSKRIGYVIASADSREKAVLACENALNLISVIVG